MKQTQLKYVIERIEAIVKTKREAIRKKYKHVLDFSDNDKVEMIKNHSVPCMIPVYFDRYTRYMDCFDYSGTAFYAEQKKMNACLDALEDYRTRLIDQIILGDAEEALSQLQTFSQMEF